MIFREDWCYEHIPLSQFDPFVAAAERLCGHTYHQTGMHNLRRCAKEVAAAELTRTLSYRDTCVCPTGADRYGPPCWVFGISSCYSAGD